MEGGAGEVNLRGEFGDGSQEANMRLRVKLRRSGSRCGSVVDGWGAHTGGQADRNPGLVLWSCLKSDVRSGHYLEAHRQRSRIEQTAVSFVLFSSG